MGLQNVCIGDDTMPHISRRWYQQGVVYMKYFFTSIFVLMQQIEIK